MYSAKLLNHFEYPRNAGDVENANAVVEVSNPVCGDVVRFSARLGNGRIEEIRFRAKGCVPAMACASAMTELARENEISVARGLTCEEVETAVDGLPEASRHASQLVVEALRKLLDQGR
jgi:nitrogen fixation NifU-like protein